MSKRAKVRTVYRRAKAHARRNKMTIGRVGGLLIAFAPAVAMAAHDYQATSGTTGDKVNQVMRWQVAHYTSYDLQDGKIKIDQLMKGWLPIIGGYAFRRGVNRLLR